MATAVKVTTGSSVTVRTIRRVTVISKAGSSLIVKPVRRVSVVKPNKTVATIGRVSVVGIGDVVGPNGTIQDGHLAVFSGGTGKFIRDGGLAKDLIQHVERLSSDIEVPSFGEYHYAIDMTWPINMKMVGFDWRADDPDVSDYQVVFSLSGSDVLSVPVNSGSTDVLQTGLSVIINTGVKFGARIERIGSGPPSVFFAHSITLLLKEA